MTRERRLLVNVKKSRVTPFRVVVLAVLLLFVLYLCIVSFFIEIVTSPSPDNTMNKVIITQHNRRVQPYV